ncbi:hypothetical protein [Bacillus sp. REN16]|uniref:hypothetical protein n=1 Tax=Bacillus sp. REN16 TaxID=2887296 RepID=UPI001E56A72F|nr:hypothetical protein [Bacillus sp. REN16]MCC3356184.1 hypothetical protein [Bacillus sp. REN16]
MNKKWFLKLMGSLLAVFLITGCNADDQNPPPEDDGLETPGEDLNNDLDNNDLDNNVTPEEDVVPGDNGLNNGDQDVVEDENNDGDLDINKDDDDHNGNNDQ